MPTVTVRFCVVVAGTPTASANMFEFCSSR